jgi:hypothetical protein
MPDGQRLKNASSAAAFPRRTGNNRHGPVLSVRCRSGPSPCEWETIMPETVVITGASAGVGRATADGFAAQGAQIGLIARGTQGFLHIHRRLDSRAATYSLQLWATEHRGALMAGTLAIVAFVTTLIVGCKPLARVYQASSEPVRLDEPGD